MFSAGNPGAHGRLVDKALFMQALIKTEERVANEAE
jgi:hypothetical protein